MPGASEDVSKICSTVHKYVDKKSTDKILPLLKKLESLKPKDLTEKERKKIYEVGSRVKRKIEDDPVRQMAGRLKEKFADKKTDKKETKEKEKVGKNVAN